MDEDKRGGDDFFLFSRFSPSRRKSLTIFDSNGTRGRKGSDNEGVVTKGGDKGWWSDSGANDREDTEFFYRVSILSRTLFLKE